jgi:predicted ester cyclase
MTAVNGTHAADGGTGVGVRSVEEVVRGVFAAIDRHDLEAVASFLHPDDVQDFLPLGRREGSEQILAVFDAFFRSFPDLRIEVRDVLTADSRACVRWHARGTFSGEPFEGIRPTGATVNVYGVDALIEVVGGLIVGNTIFYDGAAFARDVGLLPARGSRAERLLVAGFNTKTRLVRAWRRLTRRTSPRR